MTTESGGEARRQGPARAQQIATAGLFGLPFLVLHYRMRRRSATS